MRCVSRFVCACVCYAVSSIIETTSTREVQQKEERKEKKLSKNIIDSDVETMMMMKKKKSRKNRRETRMETEMEYTHYTRLCNVCVFVCLHAVVVARCISSSIIARCSIGRSDITAAPPFMVALIEMTLNWFGIDLISAIYLKWLVHKSGRNSFAWKCREMATGSDASCRKVYLWKSQRWHIIRNVDSILGMPNIDIKCDNVLWCGGGRRENGFLDSEAQFECGSVLCKYNGWRLSPPIAAMIIIIIISIKTPTICQVYCCFFF